MLADTKRRRVASSDSLKRPDENKHFNTTMSRQIHLSITPPVITRIYTSSPQTKLSNKALNTLAHLSATRRFPVPN